MQRVALSEGRFWSRWAANCHPAFPCKQSGAKKQMIRIAWCLIERYCRYYLQRPGTIKDPLLAASNHRYHLSSYSMLHLSTALHIRIYYTYTNYYTILAVYRLYQFLPFLKQQFILRQSLNSSRMSSSKRAQM